MEVVFLCVGHLLLLCDVSVGGLAYNGGRVSAAQIFLQVSVQM